MNYIFKYIQAGLTSTPSDRTVCEIVNNGSKLLEMKHQAWVETAAFVGITSTPRSFLDDVQEVSPFLKGLQSPEMLGGVVNTALVT